jgi:hypothetical protein
VRDQGLSLHLDGGGLTSDQICRMRGAGHRGEAYDVEGAQDAHPKLWPGSARIGCSRATALPWGGEGLRCWGNRPGDGIQSYVFSVRSGWRRLAERFRA